MMHHFESSCVGDLLAKIDNEGLVEDIRFLIWECNHGVVYIITSLIRYI